MKSLLVVFQVFKSAFLESSTLSLSYLSNIWREKKYFETSFFSLLLQTIWWVISRWDFCSSKMISFITRKTTLAQFLFFLVENAMGVATLQKKQQTVQQRKTWIQLIKYERFSNLDIIIEQTFVLNMMNNCLGWP